MLKAAKENNQIAYKGRVVGVTINFSMETLKGRRAWTDMLQTVREQR